MAMIIIHKGDKSLRIPAGAASGYLSAGWSLSTVPDLPIKPAEESTQEKPQEEDSDKDLDGDLQPEDTDNESEDDPEEGSEDDSEEEYEEIEVDPEELLEKPLGELDIDELNIVAEYLGIDTYKLTTEKKLRDAIKAAQKK